MTRIKQIIRYMRELEAGYDRTLEAVPTDAVFLAASGPTSGRYAPYAADPHDDADYAELPDLPMVWQPTEEPSPSRWYPARTKGHSRGTIVNPKTRKAITYSSTHEMKLVFMLCASKHVSHIEDQPSAVPVLQEDGAKRHTIDYRATMAATGTRIVVAVRPTRNLHNDGLPNTIDSINRNGLDGFADEAIILTEHELTSARAWNAASILRALRASVEDDNERLRDYASKFQGTVSLRDLVRGFDCRAAAANAVWCLIHEEILLPIRDDLRLIDAPFVQFNHKH
tara:strand:+ start:21722 stop:22570 length:849 start_codon:yes stop_codon:yes gene_type:complete